MLNRKTLRASLIPCLPLLAAGCSWFGDKPPEYVEAREVPRLEVPEDLGFVISRSGMELLDPSPGEGHRFEYTHLVRDTRSFWQKLAFWNNDLGPNYSGFYRTRVEPDTDGSRVYLLFDSGEPATTGAAEHILAIFMERLG
ncbi:MAG: hypothetical protein P8008_07320 [Gammaproteobacteria bacterium]